jgi:uncharacterized protein (DUF362 family)
MTRRRFMRLTLGAAAYVAAAPRLHPLDLDTWDVGIAVDADYERAVRRAVDLVGGIRRWVKPGSIVTVKPNIGWNSTPELHADTHPVVVRTVVALCFEAGASRVYVFDRSVNNSELTYVTSGIAAAARAAGATVEQARRIDGGWYKSVKVPGGTYLKESLVFKRAIECDAFVNVPVAKHHSSSGLTMGMKNLMGVTGDDRSRWHWQLHDAISDINLAVRSDLTVIDATWIMKQGGPTGGSVSLLERRDMVIASGNVAYADAEAAALFGVKPGSIEHLRLAEAKGIGRLSGYTVGRAVGA